jgi:alkyl sulfatase BDS1-like metallo-beta-lactamase superfamily hydrolase
MHYRIFMLIVAVLTTPYQAVAKENAYKVERSFPPYFLEHKKYFEPKVYKIGDYPVWSINNTDNWAVNSILIEGDDGLIVYDTGISRGNGEAFMKEIRKISDKPIVAIFYSHHHPDHYSGTDAIVSLEDVRSGKIKIYAWDNFEHGKEHEFGATGPSQAIRIGYYIGSLLPKEDNHHHGCCGSRYVGTSGYIPPTDTFSKDTDLTIASVKMRAFLTGGEAASEFGLYLPDYKIAIVADEILPSVPNLYTLRGGKFRDANGYIRAMDAVLALDVEHLLGTHLIPMSGRKKIIDTVTRYRDMVQWIHDQSLRYINKGYTMAELKQQFQEVPDWFENEPFSKEMYGTLEHIAPQMYAGYVGYFNGDPIEYKPTPPVEFAKRHIWLMGGRDKVYANARKAFNNDDPQWAAELLTYLIRVDHNDMEARRLKAACFRRLGYAEENTTWRSWFLTAAMELDGALDVKKVAEVISWLLRVDPRNVSVGEAFKNYRYRVAAEKAKDRHIILSIELTDDDDVTLELRNGVLIDRDGVDPKADLTVTLDRKTFNAIASDEADFEEAVDQGKVKLKGDIQTYHEFWGYFDNDVFADRVVVR